MIYKSIIKDLKLQKIPSLKNHFSRMEMEKNNNLRALSELGKGINPALDNWEEEQENEKQKTFLILSKEKQKQKHLISIRLNNDKLNSFQKTYQTRNIDIKPNSWSTNQKSYINTKYSNHLKLSIGWTSIHSQIKKTKPRLGQWHFETEKQSTTLNTFSNTGNSMETTSFIQRRNKISDLCEEISKKCSKVRGKIKHQTRYKFVTEENIWTNITKQDLGVGKKKTTKLYPWKKSNNLKEIDYVDKWSCNMAFGANKIVRQLLYKDQKLKLIKKAKMKLLELTVTRKELLNKAHDIMNKSESHTKECLRNINKYTVKE